jgi:hypothetical protein
LNDPPNDKKRHDKFFDVSRSLKDGINSIEIMSFLKNGKDDSRYACAIFVVKNIEPYDFINFVKNY